MADDAKVGLKHVSAWEKIGFVSDHQLVNTVARLFGYTLPCEVRIFKNADLGEAKKWISQPSHTAAHGTMDRIDTDFPLSGGETDKDLR